MTIAKKLALVLFVTVSNGCAGVPPSVKLYASNLPARADGQYATLDVEVRKQLVLNDALLQCKIDLSEDKKELDSAACLCVKASSDDWSADCRAWLGPHTPVLTH